MSNRRPNDHSNCILRAAAARADITPPLGTQIDGDIGRYRPTEEVRDPLYARLLVLEQNNRRFCFLSMDLLSITHEWAGRIRRMASERFGFQDDAVAVHVSQTHSAPSMGQLMLSDRLPATKKYPWLRGLDNKDYCPFALGRIEQAIQAAIEKLQPVQTGYASELDGRVAFNRRYVMRDGTSEMFGGRRRHEILHIEGPADPEVGLLAFKSPAGQIAALLMHHTCHPTHGYPHRYISADWPGKWADLIQPILGGGLPLVINGCCGNVHHNNVLDPSLVDTADRMGELLSETTRKAMGKLQDQPHPVLAWRSNTLRLPFREISKQEFDEARALIAKHPEPMWLDESHTRVDWAWCYAASKLDLEELVATHQHFDYEVQVLRVGDVGIVVLIGEPFVEGQLEIKMRSPAKRTYVAHMSNGYAGYIPTPRALKSGGYETHTSIGSKLAPEALGLIVEESVRLLDALFAGG